VDSVAGAWAALEGSEIVNAARCRAYLLAGYGPPGLKVEGECDCPEEQLRVLVGCDDAPYSTPADDLAPWYDAAIPESADFAGFFPTSFEGLESTYTREVTDTLNGGLLGRLRAEPRTLVWRGLLFGRTCCSVAYGLRWLTSVLRQARCGAECGGEKLDILVCCPPPTEEVGGVNARFHIAPSVPNVGGGTWTLSYGGDTSDPIPWNADGPAVYAIISTLPSFGGPGNIALAGMGAPGWYNFDLIFVNELGSQPITGVTADGSNLTGASAPYTMDVTIQVPGEHGTPEVVCEDCRTLPTPGLPAADDAFRTLYNVGLTEGPLVRSQRASSGRCGCSTIMEVEFTLVAGNPHFYRAPVLLADALSFEVGLCPEWQVVTSPSECVVSPGVPTDCSEPTSTIITDPHCAVATLPPVFTVDESCFCDPLAPTSVCVDVPASTFGFDFQGAPVFSIYSGSDALRATTIRLIENPLGSDCDEVGSDPCNFCEFITIRYFPAFSTLTIDGVNRRVTIELPGGDIQSGEQFMVGNYTWPLLECVDYCVCATVDGATAAADATFSLSVYPLEM